MRFMIAAITGAWLVASNAIATPIDTNGQWYQFKTGPAESFATECTTSTCLSDHNETWVFAPLPPWTFSGSAMFSLTDFGHIGDTSIANIFSVFDNGVAIGVTSAPGGGRSNCVARGLFDDPACNLLEGKFSHGSFIVGPGSHSITISVASTVSPSSAAGFFKADAIAIPEPGSLALLGSSLCLLVLAMRVRRGR